MKFIKEYVVRHTADNQVLIRCPVGTNVTKARRMMDCVKISTDVPVTKNQQCNITMSVASFEEYVGSVDGISEG